MLDKAILKMNEQNQELALYLYGKNCAMYSVFVAGFIMFEFEVIKNTIKQRR